MLASGAAGPSFQLKDTQGRPWRSSELLENGPMLLFFFKISCPVCQLIAPFMERLSKSSAMQVVGISQDNAASTKAFNGRFGLTFPVLLDESKAGYPASNLFGITSVPSLFLIEADDKISTAFSGFSQADIVALSKRAGVDVFKPGEQVPVFRAG
jgi:peroxiredoxin